MVFHPVAGWRSPIFIIGSSRGFLSLEAISAAKWNNVTLITLPPNTTHALQPLDVWVFSPMKKAYGSRSLTKAERRYSVTRKELLAMVHFVKSFRHYLYGFHFTLRTDHCALQWLRTFKEPGGQIARWLQVTEEYDFTVEHRPGSRHQNADSLSRFPRSEENSEGVLPVMALNTPGQDADTSTTAANYGTSGKTPETYKPPTGVNGFQGGQ